MSSSTPFAPASSPAPKTILGAALALISSRPRRLPGQGGAVARARRRLALVSRRRGQCRGLAVASQA
jgi:hypothetical protein